MDWPLRPGRVLSFAAAAALALAAPGCIQLSAQLLYLWKGETVPAAFDGLEAKRVAVVCLADSSAYGPDALPNTLARQVEAILAAKVKGIELIRQDKIADWIDCNNWDEVDYREIGRGVKADMVLAIDVGSFSLHDGQTLYRGRANVKTTVFDMSAAGRTVYTAGPRQFVFPANTAVPAVDMNDSRFRQLFVGVLAKNLARDFYDYDLKDDFGGDAALVGR